MQNLLELYNRTLFHVNRRRSARFHRNRDLDQAINTAKTDILNDRYDPIRRERKYSFEAFQRIKSELSSLVMADTLLNPVSNAAAKPSDFMYDVGMFVSINNGRIKWSENLQFLEKGPSSENSMERPSTGYPKHMESSVGFIFKIGGGSNTVTQAYLDYIRRPIDVVSGPELSSSTALEINTQYGVVNSSTVTYDGSVYSRDQVFTTDGVTTAFTGSGILVKLSAIDFPEHLHEDLARRAAVIILGTVENYNQRQNKTNEIEES